MGVNVFANGREISCKSGSGNVSGATPDVCLSPPSPPAGPAPLPYVLAASDSDTTDGSKTVVIDGAEVMLKDKSNFKKCTGDEAATKSLGMGVVSHNITGPVYFISWSNDVEIEDENVVRHLDMVTSNHTAKVANDTVPAPDAISGAPPDDCAAAKEAVKDARGDLQQKRFTKEDKNTPTHTLTGGVFQGTLGEQGAQTLRLAASSNLQSMLAQTAAQLAREAGSLGLRLFAAGAGPLGAAPTALSGLAAQLPFGALTGTGGNITCLGAGGGPSSVVGLHGPGQGQRFNYKPCRDKESGDPRPRPGCNMEPTSHTESRIIEDLFATAGGNPVGTLTLRIRWLQKGDPPTMSGAPCPGCKALIDFVNANTNLKVVVCDENGDSVTPEAEKPDNWECDE